MTKSAVWHPNTQMSEWSSFDTIVSGKGMWLTDSGGHRMLDGVASMWCNVWGHSNPEMIRAINKQIKKLQHSPLFNLTHQSAESLAHSLIDISPKMHKVFFSDNGSSAMEIALKMAIQYWSNIGEKKTKIATLENGYHGDTFGSMSVGYIPQFFKRFKNQLFDTISFPVPNPYRLPKNTTLQDFQQDCLEKMENRFSKDDKIAAFVMESGAQMAGGVVIFPQGFQSRIKKLCKKYDILFVLDEIATGFGRLGQMVQYTEQNSTPDIVSYGKMLTGGYMTLAATLTNKKVYDTFLGNYDDWVHLFHGHTYTANPIATASAVQNLKMYKKYNLLSQIQKTSRTISKYIPEIHSLDGVGDVRHKGMLLGIEMVSDKKKTPIQFKQSVNKVFFEAAKKNNVYLRTLGNIVMIVPPLAISQKEMQLLLQKTIQTIKDVNDMI